VVPEPPLKTAIYQDLRRNTIINGIADRLEKTPKDGVGHALRSAGANANSNGRGHGSGDRHLSLQNARQSCQDRERRRVLQPRSPIL